MAEQSVTMRSLASRRELTESLALVEFPTHIVGGASDSPREFFGVEVREGSRPVLGIGILSSGTGIKPSWLLKKDKLLVGFNDRVAIFSIKDPASKNEVGLLSPFWEFADLEEHSHTCVVCETAVAAILPSGLLMWRADLDLITKYERAGNTMRLQFADAPPVRLDLISGGRLPK